MRTVKHARSMCWSRSQVKLRCGLGSSLVGDRDHRMGHLRERKTRRQKKRNRAEFVTGRGSGKRLVMAHAEVGIQCTEKQKVLFAAIFAMLNCLTSCVILFNGRYELFERVQAPAKRGKRRRCCMSIWSSMPSTLSSPAAPGATVSYTPSFATTSSGLHFGITSCLACDLFSRRFPFTLRAYRQPSRALFSRPSAWKFFVSTLPWRPF